MTEKLSRFWTWIQGWVRGILSVLNVLVDYIYDRADLWQNKQHQVADHAKVRSFFLYASVTVVFLRLAFFADQDKPLSPLLLGQLGLAMLALSAGERVLVSFFKSRTPQIPQGGQGD